MKRSGPAETRALIQFQVNIRSVKEEMNLFPLLLVLQNFKLFNLNFK
jgi:hypothetical protein